MTTYHVVNRLNPTLKVILLASRDYGVFTLKALIDRKDTIDVVGVVPGDELFRTAAADLGVNVMTPDDINSEKFISEVRRLQADVLVNAFFLRKYGARLLRTPRFGVLNVHPSMLPYYRGRDCIRWAIVNGENEIGITVHQMDEGLDTGEILVQAAVPLSLDDNYRVANDKMKARYPSVVVEAIERVGAERIERKKQHLGEGTYFPHRRPEDSKISWSDISIDIHNLIRANIEPGFYAYSFLGEKKIFIEKSKVRRTDYEKISRSVSQRLGRVLDYDNEDETRSSMLIGTLDGAISVERCGFEEKKMEPARKLLKRGDMLR